MERNREREEWGEMVRGEKLGRGKYVEGRLES